LQPRVQRAFGHVTWGAAGLGVLRPKAILSVPKKPALDLGCVAKNALRSAPVSSAAVADTSPASACVQGWGWG